MRNKTVAALFAIILLALSSLGGLRAETADSLGSVSAPADSLGAVPAPADSIVIGYSVSGQPLRLYHWGKHSQPRILILGGVHGDEGAAAEFADSLVSFLRGRDAEVSGRDLFILPLLNPDGLAAKTRQNANGVDLNRNWPSRDFGPDNFTERQFGGKTPLSEPETKALSALMEQLNPGLLVILHTPLNCINYDGPAEELAAKLAKDLELPLRSDIGYPTPGSLGTYYGKERGLPVITLEFPNQSDLWASFGPALLASLGIFQLP